MWLKHNIQRSSWNIWSLSSLFKYSNISWFSTKVEIKGEFKSGIPLPWVERRFLQCLLESGRLIRSFVRCFYLVCHLPRSILFQQSHQVKDSTNNVWSTSPCKNKIFIRSYSRKDLIQMCSMTTMPFFMLVPRCGIG